MKRFKFAFAASCLFAAAVSGCPCQPPLDPRDQWQDKTKWWTDPPRDRVTYDPDVSFDDAVDVVEESGGIFRGVDDVGSVLMVTYVNESAVKISHVTAANVRTMRSKVNSR